MMLFLDIFGTLIFALSGGFRAVKYELDILGVLILATSTGVGGGICRDVILGAHPPAAFRSEYYIVTCLVGGLLVFFFAHKLAFQWRKIIISDALGLGVFTAIGASKALSFGLGPVGVVMMGCLTATGGGVIRDILVSEIPAVIKSDFYATASILGGCVFLVINTLCPVAEVTIPVTIIATTGMRMLAMKYNVHLPQVKKLPASPSELSKK